MALTYDPLRQFLAASVTDRVILSFAQIELILEHSLPPSARKLPRRRQWWANDRTHSQGRAWLGANFETGEVDSDKETVAFVRCPTEWPTAAHGASGAP